MCPSVQRQAILLVNGEVQQLNGLTEKSDNTLVNPSIEL